MILQLEFPYPLLPQILRKILLLTQVEQIISAYARKVAE